ncbi:glutaredoxin family protein [Bacillus methanolicus]|uniref:glutaredoxin family protein n=1 Tax=Bacillus methanolicus TaxID=1471 RepID=UPI00200E7F56|nr:glutaredoxin family protein [Bacillus methanolicus]UQD53662.1 glutaredoxin family protein [Bacillus methanolicus]
MNKQVIVYSAQGCNECNMVKQMLTQEGIPFEVRDVLANPEYQKEVEKFGFMGIPVTVVEDQAVKGFNPTELKKLMEAVRN